MLNSTECCTREAILRECHVFVIEMGISESSFGRNAVNDGSLMARLRDGKDINTKKLDRLRAYMAHERTRRAEAGARRAMGYDLGIPRLPSAGGFRGWLRRLFGWFRP